MSVKVYKLGRGVALIEGEALEALSGMPENRLHSMVTDPPSGAEFMQKSWDCFRRARNPNDVARPTVHGRLSRTAPHSYGETARANFVSSMTAVFAHALRVLRPGAHGLVWALPRTSHWTAWALEDAGFEIRDSIHHLFGSGYPKSHDVAKNLDKRAGVKPIREEKPSLGMANDPQWNTLKKRIIMPPPTTEDAREWAGWNTVLKPGHEVWWLVRKPLEKKLTIVQNVVRWRTGALNLDACRLPYANEQDRAKARPGGKTTSKVGRIGARPDAGTEEARGEFEAKQNDLGRWPPNFVFTHSIDCEEDGTCAEDCPVRELDEQAGPRPRAGDLGGKTRQRHGLVYKPSLGDDRPWTAYRDGPKASKFFPTFYCKKPTKKEKNAGLEHLTPKTPEELTGRKAGSPGLVMEGGKANPYAGPSGQARANHHPTPKATDLCAWLARLVTPPGGIVLDPFAGSASIGVSCVDEGFGCVAIERDRDGDGKPLGYVPIALGRLRLAIARRSSS